MDAKGFKKTMTSFFFFLITVFSLSLPAEGAVPAAPAGLTAIAGNGESSLTWGAVPGAARYLLYRGTVSGGPYSFVSETEGTAYADHGLSNNSTYYYVVTALNADGQSPYSSPVNATPTATVLKAPAGLTALPGNGEASLSWNPVTSAVSYNIYRATSSGGPYTLLTPSAPGPSMTDRGLTNGTAYCYVAQTTMGATNAGAYSDEVCATPSTLLPVAPAMLTATPGNGWASLSWSAVEGASAYLVYRGTKIGGPYELIALPNTNTFDDLEIFFNETTYYYVVATVIANGRGAFSAETSAAVSANAKPHAPVLTALPYDKQVHLSWDGASGAVSYTMHRATTSGGPYTTLGITSSSSVYDDTDLANGATYYYVVDAHNASPTVARSNEVVATPAVVLPPPPPTNVTVIPGNTQATVTWDPVGGASGYKILIATSPGAGEMDTTVSSSDGKPSYTAVTLTNGQIYYFRVQSTSIKRPYSVECTYSAYSAEVSATPVATLPLAPTNLQINQIGNRQQSLTWTAATGAASYKVYRRTAGSAWSSAPMGSPAATLFTDTGLTNGTQYYYSVAAVNADGTGAWSVESPEHQGTPTACALPVPTNVAVIPGNTQATVTWDPVVGTENYYITIASSPGGVKIVSISDGTADGKPSFTAKGLTNGQTYYFRVECNGLSSAYSAEVSTTPATPLPLAPENLVVRPGNGQLSITWPAVVGATSYKIYRRTKGIAWSADPIGSPRATLFTDMGLTNGTKYYYSVAAVNANGAGAWSAATDGTPTVVSLPAPTNVAVTPGDRQATVCWDPVVGAEYYDITIASSPGGPWTSGGYAYGKSSYTAANLTNGQTYYFRVNCRNPSSAYSAEVSIIPNSAANIGNIFGRVSVNFSGYGDLGVRNASVSLQGTSYSASPDANGNFSLLNIPFGNYSLVVTAPNMDTVTQEISLAESSLPVTIPPMVVSVASCLDGDANVDKRLNLADVIYLLQILTGDRQ